MRRRIRLRADAVRPPAEAALPARAMRPSMRDRRALAARLGLLVPLLGIAAATIRARRCAELWRLLGVPLLAIALFLLVWARWRRASRRASGSFPGPRRCGSRQGAVGGARGASATRRRRSTRARNAQRGALRARIRAADVTRAPVHRQADLLRPDPHQPEDGVHGLRAGDAGRGAARHPVRAVARPFNAAINPLVQMFKPVSPLAWLPIVTMVVSAVYVSADPLLEKSFVISAITVTLCSLWPTLINTALGVALDRQGPDERRPRAAAGWFTQAAQDRAAFVAALIFTGLRLSLGVGWMVLIAAEMLAQNPGLGKFVWDEFQNGCSSRSPDHGRCLHDRPHRLPARPDHAGSAGCVQPRCGRR